MPRRYVARVVRRRHRPHSSFFGIPTSEVEIIDILKAWIVISVIFAIIRTRLTFGVSLFAVLFSAGFAREVALAGITVGIGFLFHELAHKVVAQRFGCAAEFRSQDSLLMIALVMAFFLGFVFIAPGATIIAGQVTRKQSGIIALAGPWANIVIASFFALAAFLPYALMQEVAGLGYLINVWLGLFNMIPFFILDGRKVWAWSKLAWLGTVILLIALLLSPFPLRSF